MAGIYGRNNASAASANQTATQQGGASGSSGGIESKRAAFWGEDNTSKPTHGLKAALEKNGGADIPMTGGAVQEFLAFVGGQCFGGKPKAEPPCEQPPVQEPPPCQEPPVQEPPSCEEPPKPECKKPPKPACQEPPPPPACEEPPVQEPPCEEPPAPPVCEKEPEPPCEEPPPPPPAYNGGKKAHCEGDPHFMGFDGEKFDVQGEAGKVYNILSDKGLQYNGRFESWSGTDANIIEEAGLRVGDQTVTYNAKTGAATLNGESIAEGFTNDWIQFGDGRLKVTSPEYIVELQRMENTYLNSDVHLNTDNPLADGVNPHGIMGQTADGDGIANPDAHGWSFETGYDASRQQGGGVLQRVGDDGSVVTSAKDDLTVHRQYEMTGMLDITATDARAQQFVRYE
ncbi:MAG: hypothetical protein AB7P76_10350 [Candidatus Melainabacteria bacterium]